MLKTVKNFDNISPCDTFEKITLETSQTGTWILLLESDEDDVIIRACKALFKFSEKSDENKMFLFENNCYKKFVQFLQYDLLTIRRLSCMLLSNLLQLSDLAKEIVQSEPNMIGQLLCLLNEKSDIILEEYITLCLSYLSTLYYCKLSIFYSGGLPHLLNCIVSFDPDVQYNALKTIAQMLLDCEIKNGLITCDNSLSNLINIISTSEFPILKQLALAALDLIIDNRDCKIALTQLNFVKIILDHLNDEKTDRSLISYFYVLLSNCLDDKESIETFEEYGGMDILFSVIQNISQNNQEDKTLLKEKSNLKNKKDKVVQDEVLNIEAKHANLDFVQQPELDEVVCNIIDCLSKDELALRSLQEENIENFFLFLLKSHKEKTVEKAILALSSFFLNEKSRKYFIQQDGLTAFKMVSDAWKDSIGINESLSLALANLTNFKCSEYNLNADIFEEIPWTMISSFLSYVNERTLLNTCIIIYNLTFHETQRNQLIDNEAMQVLSELLLTQIAPNIQKKKQLPFAGSNLLIEKILMVFYMLAIDVSGRSKFFSLNIMEPVLGLIDCEVEMIRNSLCLLLARLVSNQKNSNELCKFNAHHKLFRLNNSCKNKTFFTEKAFLKLLDFRPIEKFAFFGFLDDNNYMTDGFYDIGQLSSLKHDLTSLRSIEEFYKEPLNNCRPIYLLNSIEEETINIQINESIENKLKATEKDKSAKNKSKKSKKEKADEIIKENNSIINEETNIQDKDVSFKVPYDKNLFDLVDTCKKNFMNILTCKDRIISLAVLVSNHFGGQIQKNAIDYFEWKEHITKLKLDQQNNILPLGIIKFGIHYHRALLFKFISDKVGLQNSLYRGNYNRSWNEVTLLEECTEDDEINLKQKRFIVDLIHRPGNLMLLDTKEADDYKLL